MTSYEKCTMGEKCQGFRELGRAVYLKTKDAIASGLCQQCRDAGIKSHSFSQDYKMEMDIHYIDPVDGQEFDFKSMAERSNIVSREQMTEAVAALAGPDASTSIAAGFTEVDDDELPLLAPGYERDDAERRANKYMKKIQMDAAAALAKTELSRVTLSKDSPVMINIYEGFEIEDETRKKYFDQYLRDASLASDNHLLSFFSSSVRYNVPTTTTPRTASSLPSLYDYARQLSSGINLRGLQDDSVKVWDFNCSALLSKDETKKIFGTTTPEQVAVAMAEIYGIWHVFSDKSLQAHIPMTRPMLGSENLGAMAGSSAHYSLAVSSGFWLDMLNERQSSSAAGLKLQEWLEEVYVQKHGFKNDKETLRALLADSSEVDDYLYNPEALDWIVAKSKAGSKYVTPERVAFYKDVQAKVVAFTDAIDKKWHDSVEKDPLAALKQRFGHPAGWPSYKVKEHLYMPGGEMIESGWAHVEDGKAATFKIDLPIDKKTGRPDATYEKWDPEALNPRIVVRTNGSNLEKLGDMAAGAASAYEAWHVCMNYDLPRDNLFVAAQYAQVVPPYNSLSQDGFSGTVCGGFHPALKGIELATPSTMRFYPTVKSRISALRRDLVSDEIAPNGVLTLKEIDLCNWRLQRFNDNCTGTEHAGGNFIDSASKVAPPLAVDKLTREYHEKIQDSILSQGHADGLETYPQQEDMVRPILAGQNGEAVREYFVNPGRYLRRTGSGGSVVADGTGVGIGVYEAVAGRMQSGARPLRIADSHRLGYTEKPHKAVSAFPYFFVAPGSGQIIVDDENGKKIWQRFQKRMSASYDKQPSGSIRFASKSLGETGTKWGLLVSKDFTDSYEMRDAIQQAELTPDLLADPFPYLDKRFVGYMGSSEFFKRGTAEPAEVFLKPLSQAKGATVKDAFHKHHVFFSAPLYANPLIDFKADSSDQNGKKLSPEASALLRTAVIQNEFNKAHAYSNFKKFSMEGETIYTEAGRAQHEQFASKGFPQKLVFGDTAITGNTRATANQTLGSEYCIETASRGGVLGAYMTRGLLTTSEVQQGETKPRIMHREQHGLGLRVGGGPTGAEHVAVCYDEQHKIKDSGKFLKQWGKSINSLGAAGDLAAIDLKNDQIREEMKFYDAPDRQQDQHPLQQYKKAYNQSYQYWQQEQLDHVVENPSERNAETFKTHFAQHVIFGTGSWMNGLVGENNADLLLSRQCLAGYDVVLREAQGEANRIKRESFENLKKAEKMAREHPHSAISQVMAQTAVQHETLIQKMKRLQAYLSGGKILKMFKK